MTRQEPLPPEGLDADQRELYDAITGGPRGQGPQAFALVDEGGVLQGPFGGFLLSPPLGDALQRLGAAVRYRSALSDRMREMAILVVAAHWDSAFERAAHEAVGRVVGVSEHEVAAIAEQRDPGLVEPTERAAVELTRALVLGDVDDATWQRCVPPLNQRDVFELTTLVGYYATLALQMRVFRV